MPAFSLQDHILFADVPKERLEAIVRRQFYEQVDTIELLDCWGNLRLTCTNRLFNYYFQPPREALTVSW